MLVKLMEEIKNAFKILFGKHWWDRACSTNGEKRNAYRILVGKPKETAGKTKT
jgi:hypothetical protein